MNRNKVTYNIMTLVLLTVLASFLGACVNNGSYNVDENEEEEGYVLHVSLSVNVQGEDGGSTRADVPNGGEEGDGWQYGLESENKLHNFTVFVLDNNNNVSSPTTSPSPS